MIQIVKKIEKEAMKSSDFDFIRLVFARHMEMDIDGNDVSKMHSIIAGEGIVLAIIFFIIEGGVL